MRGSDLAFYFNPSKPKPLRGGCVCVAKGVYGNSVLYAQFWYKRKTDIKKSKSLKFTTKLKPSQ